jgi:hypothetical protein
MPRVAERYRQLKQPPIVGMLHAPAGSALFAGSIMPPLQRHRNCQRDSAAEACNLVCANSVGAVLLPGK